MESSRSAEADVPTPTPESGPEQLRTDHSPTLADAIESNGHLPPPTSSDEEQQPGVVPPEEPSLASPALTLPAALEPEVVPLEQRLRRLEQAVKEIQETRVTDRPTPEPPPAARRCAAG